VQGKELSMTQLSLGLDTFGDVTVGPDGQPQAMDRVLREVLDQATLADEIGIDFIGLGEHHRADFAISAPEIVLAAIAGRTRRIKLGTAVTVLSTDDPVRVFQRFSTLNALSNGRAEPILGRGSFTESYPLFGHDLQDYEQLFETYPRAPCDLVGPDPQRIDKSAGFPAAGPTHDRLGRCRRVSRKRGARGPA
jgi:alkanesulfonate monooxygenase SsuD/methylene tetrahydromethanopterin reductase-like flavin-dependent oxidoreductase (luciferase family)